MKINGVNVVDASKKIVLHISPRDVAKGDNKNPSACAAAQACLRQLHADDARVHIGRTYLKIDNKWVRYRTSKALRSEIVAFDRGGKFMPGEYTLEPMPPSDRLGRKKEKGPKLQKRGPRRRYHIVAGIREHGANR